MLFICALSFGQIKEKYVDTDSLQTAGISINESAKIDSIVNYEDIDTNINYVVYNDTCLRY